MSSTRRRLLQNLGMVFVAGRIGAARASAGSLTVLTGLPKPMVAAVEREFRAAHPEIDLRMQWSAGKDAMPLLHAQSTAPADVYWAASLHNFHALADQGRLRRLSVDRRQLPGRIGAQPQSDPAGRFEATDTAGYAIATNETYLADLGLPVPTRFADLADPRLYGHVVLPVPGRIGYAAPLYEHWLQTYGWQAGFELLQGVAANAELCAAHGGEVTERLARGEAGAGVSLDFFAREAARKGTSITTRYPADTLYSPALVGIMDHAGNAPAAQRFVDFLLSKPGQQLMAGPVAGRLSMRPATCRQMASDVPDPFQPECGTVTHNVRTGLKRQPLVTLLFDAAITSHHGLLATVWRDLAAAERSGRIDAATLAAARRVAARLPLSEQEGECLALRSADPRSRALREEWRNFFAANYRAAARLIAGGERA